MTIYAHAALDEKRKALIKFQCRFAPLLVPWRHRPALPPQNRPERGDVVKDRRPEQ
jgi:hypothetical protein